VRDGPFVDPTRSHLLPGGSPDEDERRVTRIADESRQAFERLAAVRKAVSIFGSAREAPAERWGEASRRTARLLGAQGFAVITGGGPGLMATANEGAAAAEAESIGLTIDLPTQEAVNRHVTLAVPFHYFFLRKLAFVKYSCAFVCFPGGFGTLDELFEALNLVLTHKLSPFPVLLYDTEFWSGLREWMRREAVAAGTLSEADLTLLELVDSPEEVVARVVECHETLCRILGARPGGGE
jgi:uncharacterized protein (TIGR00730 family)